MKNTHYEDIKKNNDWERRDFLNKISYLK